MKEFEFIKDIFEKIIIENYNWININNSLNNFTKINVSVSLGNSEYREIIKHALMKELTISIISKIIDKISDTQNIEYLDLRNGLDITIRKFEDGIDGLINLILLNKYNTLMTNVKVASVIQDSSYFRLNLKRKLDNNLINYIGDLYNCRIWVDPFIKYNDTEIYLFNNVDINLNNIQINEDYLSYSLTCEYDFEVKDSKKILIIENETSEIYQKYKSSIRDIKINEILNSKNETNK